MTQRLTSWGEANVSLSLVSSHLFKEVSFQGLAMCSPECMYVFAKFVKIRYFHILFKKVI